MTTSLKEPHLFNAGSNPMRVIRNLSGILSEQELDKIRHEIVVNVIGLFRLGEAHFTFAQGIQSTYWRQRVSRLYYSAYNVRRAIALKHDGTFSTDSSDHKNVDVIPDSLSNAATYKARLLNLREDRNLADYNHLAVEADLLISVGDYESFAADFLRDARAYLVSRSVAL